VHFSGQVSRCFIALLYIVTSRRFNFTLLIFFFILHFLSSLSHTVTNFLQRRGGQIGARKRHVAFQNVFGGPRKDSGKSSNLKDLPTQHRKRYCRANSNRDLLQFPLKGAALRFTQPSVKWPPSQLNCPPLL